MAIKEFFREGLIDTVTALEIRLIIPLGIDITEGPIGPTLSQFGMVTDEFFEDFTPMYDGISEDENNAEEDVNVTDLNIQETTSVIVKEDKVELTSKELSKIAPLLQKNLDLYESDKKLDYFATINSNVSFYLKNGKNKAIKTLDGSLNTNKDKEDEYITKNWVDLIKEPKAFMLTLYIRRTYGDSVFRYTEMRGPTVTGLLARGYFNKILFKRYLNSGWAYNYDTDEFSRGFRKGISLFIEDICLVAELQLHLEMVSQFNINFSGICGSVLSTAYSMNNGIIFYTSKCLLSKKIKKDD